VLSERLRSAQEQQDKVSKPKVPVLPLSAYWRAELLAANELLDQTYHHGPQGGSQQPVSSAEGAAEALLGEPAAAVEGQAALVLAAAQGQPQAQGGKPWC
jgi:hypothetical protein